MFEAKRDKIPSNMPNKQLAAKERKIFGRKVKQLRKQGKIPANVFGPKTKSKAVTIDKKTFMKVFDEVGETSLVNLEIEGEKEARPVLITNLHLDPVTNEVLHADLHQVDLTAKTSADIPVETVGKAPAVDKGGILVMLLNEIEVEALPTDLPEKFEIDVSALEEIGDSVLAKDLKLDRAKVELKVDDEEPIVTIQEPKEEEPEPVSVEEEAEGAEEAKGTDEEGEGEKKEGEGEEQEQSQEGKQPEKESEAS